MTNCILPTLQLPACKRRRVEVDFSGGDISSNGGVGLLDLAERRIGLLSDLAGRLDDGRQAGKVRHGLLPLLRQRVYSVALGYEDANDHDALRDDLALQTACGGDRRLASASTIGRLDRAADRAWTWAAHEAMVETFIASFDAPPEELILDFDATDGSAWPPGRPFLSWLLCHRLSPIPTTSRVLPIARPRSGGDGRANGSPDSWGRRTHCPIRLLQIYGASRVDREKPL